MVGVHACLKMKGRNICPPILHRLGTAASDRYNPYIHASVIKRRSKGVPAFLSRRVRRKGIGMEMKGAKYKIIFSQLDIYALVNYILFNSGTPKGT